MSLTLKEITKRFTRRGVELTVLEDISLEVEDEEFLCILGPSGCGKTTLLRIIAGLEVATSGTVRVNEKEVSGPTPELAMIFQEYSLFPWRTVIENILFGLECRGLPQAEQMDQAKKYLDLVGLTEFAGSYPYELSGGMRQRVAVARAIAVNPSVLLMDEPFGALDAQTRNMLQKELLEIWQKTRKTILFVTHSVDEAVFLADRIVVLSRNPGRIRQIIDVTADRPRDRTCNECALIRREVLALIEEEH